MYRYAVAIVALLACAEAKFYTDCGSKLGTLESVAISGCAEESRQCVLKRDTNVTFDIEFTPTADVKSIDTVVHGIIMDLPVPFPMPQSDACIDSGLTCPLKKGEKVHYRATMPVLKSYPKVSVKVKWELQNEDEEDLICILIPAKLQ